MSNLKEDQIVLKNENGFFEYVLKELLNSDCLKTLFVNTNGSYKKFVTKSEFVAYMKYSRLNYDHFMTVLCKLKDFIKLNTKSKKNIAARITKLRSYSVGPLYIIKTINIYETLGIFESDKECLEKTLEKCKFEFKYTIMKKFDEVKIYQEKLNGYIEDIIKILIEIDYTKTINSIKDEKKKDLKKQINKLSKKMNEL